MPRLYLILFSLSIYCISFGQQKEVNSLLKNGDEKFVKGDYYYALSFYHQALKLDSNTVDILWKTAEAYRAYKDYRMAEYYYGKVYEKEGTKLFPYSLLNYALMQKQNEKYPEALKSFKQAVRKYSKDRKGYLYLKAKKEVESTTWAISNQRIQDHVIVDHLPKEINTPNSEFGSTIYQNQLYFSSLRADSITTNEEVYTKDYKTRIYTSELMGETYDSSQLVASLSLKKKNTGNGSFSLDGKRFYFSICKDNDYNYQCKIAVARFEDGHFSDIDTLGEIINQDDANTTMPSIGKLDGREVLFFSSNREKINKMEVYFSIIKNGNQYGAPINIEAINTKDDDITPFWDDKNQRLYFASSWHNGFGGFDVFYSQYESNRFLTPTNAGQPVNSPANDYYYFKNGDSAYVTSNRIGVYYSKNPTCCTDIFSIYPPIQLALTPKETLEDLNKRLPVTLYFHNDWPDPKTSATTTNIDYINNYHDYRALLPIYKKEYSKGLFGENAEEAKEDIESFFVEYVDKGVNDLNLFRDLMLDELNKGVSLELTIKGFASPLAKSDYNVNLTKRRISSLINYLRNYNQGVFDKYIDGTAINGAILKFKEIPFGEYTSQKFVSDNINDQKNSVYSRAASLERKIEIQSVSILSKDSSNVIDAKDPIHHFGKISSSDSVSTTFNVQNVSKKNINFQQASIDCSCITVTYDKETLQPGEVAKVTVVLKPKGKVGNIVQYVRLKTIESNLEETLVITAEINP